MVRDSGRLVKTWLGLHRDLEASGKGDVGTMGPTDLLDSWDELPNSNLLPFEDGGQIQ